MSNRGKKPKAGLLLFKRLPRLQVFLVHPGTPYAAGELHRVWTIAKGSPEGKESMLDAARREFVEETGIVPLGPYLELGSAIQSGKVVTAWAWEGDADPAHCVSISTRSEKPHGSGRWIEHPEVDGWRWLTLDEARKFIVPVQASFLEKLVAILSATSS